MSDDPRENPLAVVSAEDMFDELRRRGMTVILITREPSGQRGLYFSAENLMETLGLVSQAGHKIRRMDDDMYTDTDIELADPT